MELVAPGWKDYEVIDSGDGLRLERLGEVVISRQCAQAIWPRALSEEAWKARCHASHYRHDQGPGEWSRHRPTPEKWVLRLDELRMEVRLNDFGHIGMFAEQQVQWSWLAEKLRTRPKAKVLNLFAYTGGSSLAAAVAGAQVTHLDALKGAVTWARGNAAHSGLQDAPIRWIVDDARKFVQRELRRGNLYDAVILDPPTFGRSPEGKVWKFERDLSALLGACEKLLVPEPLFLLLSAHTPGVSAGVLRNLLSPLHQRRGGRFESGDMLQRCAESPLLVPAGVFCRWTPTS